MNKFKTIFERRPPPPPKPIKGQPSLTKDTLPESTKDKPRHEEKKPYHQSPFEPQILISQKETEAPKAPPQSKAPDTSSTSSAHQIIKTPETTRSETSPSSESAKTPLPPDTTETLPPTEAPPIPETEELKAPQFDEVKPVKPGFISRLRSFLLQKLSLLRAKLENISTPSPRPQTTPEPLTSPLKNFSAPLLTFTDLLEQMLTIKRLKIYLVAFFILIVTSIGISSAILFFSPESEQPTLSDPDPSQITPTASPQSRESAATAPITTPRPAITTIPQAPLSPDEIFKGEQTITLKPADTQENWSASVTRVQTENLSLIEVKAYLPSLPQGFHYELWGQNQSQSRSYGKLERTSAMNNYILKYQEQKLPEKYKDLLNTMIITAQNDNLSSEADRTFLIGRF